MMKQQPDIFFREKLQDYQKPMPGNAWDKIEINLNEKKNKRLWLKLAASVSILLVASYLVWLESSPEIISLKTTTGYNQTNKKLSQKRTANHKDATPIKDIQKVKSKLHVKDNLEPIETDSNFDTRNQNIASAHETSEELENELSIAKNPIKIFSDLRSDTLSTNVNDTNSSDEMVSQHKLPVADHITLIYTADEVQEKYLDKNGIEEATIEDKKPSTIKKLLDKIYSLKNGQHPFGDLRQKKDEILALNFKKRTQN